MRVIIEIVSGFSTGKRLELLAGQNAQVGRASWAQLSLVQDRSMAGLHFTLACDQEKCLLTAQATGHPTFVNDQKVLDAFLYDGDEIIAGDNTFAVHIEGGAPRPAPAPPPLAAKPSLPPSMAQPPGTQELSGVSLEGALSYLRGQQPLYAVLDAARNPKVRKLLTGSKARYQSLFEGSAARERETWAPYLVHLPREAPLLETLVREGWGNSWGIYLSCSLPFEEGRKHLRHFLTAEIEGQGQVFFRFYDPRVLRFLLPTCDPHQTAELFGPLRCYLMEAKDPNFLLKFTAHREGAKEEVVPLFQVEEGKAPSGAR